MLSTQVIHYVRTPFNYRTAFNLTQFVSSLGSLINYGLYKLQDLTAFVIFKIRIDIKNRLDGTVVVYFGHDVHLGIRQTVHLIDYEGKRQKT